MPAESRSTLLTLMGDNHGLHEDYGTESVKEEAVRMQFFKLRRQLQEDAKAIMSSELPHARRYLTYRRKPVPPTFCKNYMTTPPVQ